MNKNILISALIIPPLLTPLLAQGSITDLSSGDIFNSNHESKRVGTYATGALLNAKILGDVNTTGVSGLSLLGVTIDGSLSRFSSTETGASPTSWSHEVGGFIQVSTAVPVFGGNLADAQIRSYAEVSQTDGTLQFGREITLNGAGADLGTLLAPLAGASVLQSWDSTATVTASTEAGQAYRVTFNVNTDGGLPVNLLNNFQFSVLGDGIEDSSGGSATLLNLIDLLTLGSGNNALATFEFVSTQALDEIGFQFQGEAVGSASALGGDAANENFATFSGLSITAIPEASSAALILLAGFVGMARRRR